jgi:hypothetical protein
VAILTRRNAILGWATRKVFGWSTWTLGKRLAMRKARSVTPSVEGGRPNRPLVAISLAGLAGALTFWRKRRRGSESS